MDAEKILDSLPRFNSLQLIVVLSVGFLCFRGPWQIFAISFIAEVPVGQKCSVAEDEADLFNSTECELINLENNNASKCNAWHYEMYGGGNSIVTEWNLVCGSDYLLTLDQTLYVTGQMIGALFLAPLSDRVGRRPTIIIGLVIHLVLSLGLMFSVNMYMFIAIRFIMGCVHQMVVTSSYVLMAEWFSLKWRTVATNSIMTFWVLGIITMPGIAYVVKHWRGLILAYSVIPDCVVFVLIFLLPESLFYLIANGKFREVAKLLGRIKWPVDAVTHHTMGSSTMEMVSRASAIDEDSQREIQNEAHNSMRKAARQLLHSPKMLSYSLALFWLSITLNLTYYVATIMTGELSGDRYVNYVLSGVVELPFVIATMVLSAFLPRSVLIFALYFVASVSLMLFGFTGITAFAFSGRGAISGCYIIQLLYATEMFPTVVRNAGLGFYQVAENLGPVIGAPIEALPWAISGPTSLYFFLGILSLTNLVIISVMPETKGYSLPETVDEIDLRPGFAFWNYLLCKNGKNDTVDSRKKNEETVQFEAARKDEVEQKFYGDQIVVEF